MEIVSNTPGHDSEVWSLNYETITHELAPLSSWLDGQQQVMQFNDYIRPDPSEYLPFVREFDTYPAGGRVLFASKGPGVLARMGKDLVAGEAWKAANGVASNFEIGADILRQLATTVATVAPERWIDAYFRHIEPGSPRETIDKALSHARMQKLRDGRSFCIQSLASRLQTEPNEREVIDRFSDKYLKLSYLIRRAKGKRVLSSLMSMTTGNDFMTVGRQGVDLFKLDKDAKTPQDKVVEIDHWTDNLIQTANKSRRRLVFKQYSDLLDALIQDALTLRQTSDAYVNALQDFAGYRRAERVGVVTMAAATESNGHKEIDTEGLKGQMQAERQAFNDKKRNNETTMFNTARQIFGLAGQQIQQLEAPWRLSSRQLKRLDLNGVIAGAVKGVHNAAGSELLPGRSKGEAHILVGSILFARSLAEATINGEISETLQKRLDAEADLKSRLSEASKVMHLLPGPLRAQLLEARPTFRSTFSLLDSLRQDWSGVSALIKCSWPRKEAHRVIEDISKVLEAVDNFKSDKSDDTTEAA